MATEEQLSRLEASLNSFDPELRRKALVELAGIRDAEGAAEYDLIRHNLHCHTFFSYNGYGYSPSYIAWWQAQEGLFAAGIVDFDVLDAADEYLDAVALLNVRGVCGLETRAFFPEFSTQVLNSPGEPGISYHMGVGFSGSKVPDAARPFLVDMKKKAQARTRGIVAAVNAFLSPLELDYSEDVEVLTPAGNATERHVCAAYFRKAESLFADTTARIEFWSSKLGTDKNKIADIIDDRVAMEALIRAKTMKSGGPGYVQPDPAAFPTLKDMNNFIVACGAIPTIAWLDGFSEGEKDVDKLLDLHIINGARALNIIPDRNWNFADSQLAEKKIAELNRIITAALKRDLPIIVGTEMNAPGLKLVDDFDSPALAPHAQTFVNGAAFMFAHTLLSKLGKGSNSAWAREHFKSAAELNAFYTNIGKNALPADLEKLGKAGELPTDILKAARA